MIAHLSKYRFLSGLLLISFFFLYWKVFETLTMQWRHNVMYSHGFLIPLISLYLVWVRKDQLARIPYIPKHRFAFTAIGIGLMMMLFGHVAGIQIIQAFSLIFAVTGVVILLFGYLSLKIFGVSIVYLLFMFPIWEEAITGHLHLPFQKFSAVSGHTLLKLIGIPAYREGLFITLPNTVLEVARACSGINHLVAVIAIGIPLAYLFLSSWTKRVLLILIAVVIAILSNSLRIALIGILSYLNIGGPIHGPFHVLQGLFVSAIGYVTLIATTWVLSEKSPSPRTYADKKDVNISGSPGRVFKNRMPHALLLTIIIFWAVGSYMHFFKFSPVPLRNSLDNFPEEIGMWVGIPTISPFSKWFKEVNADQELSRVYRENNHTGNARPFELYIAYFEMQDSKKKVINYRTEEFHKNTSVVNIDIEAGDSIKINKLYYTDYGREKLVYFWYDIHGQIVHGRIQAKLKRAWNGFLKGNTNGAIIILSSDVILGGDYNGAEARMNEFIKVFYPLLSSYLPGH